MTAEYSRDSEAVASRSQKTCFLNIAPDILHIYSRETFLKDFLELLKRIVSNFKKIFKKYFLTD